MYANLYHCDFPLALHQHYLGWLSPKIMETSLQGNMMQRRHCVDVIALAGYKNMPEKAQILILALDSPNSAVQMVRESSPPNWPEIFEARFQARVFVTEFGGGELDFCWYSGMSPRDLPVQSRSTKGKGTLEQERRRNRVATEEASRGAGAPGSAASQWMV